MQQREDQPKDEVLKTQGLFILARFLLFFAIIGIVLIVLLGVLRYRAFPGSVIEKPTAGEIQYQKPAPQGR